MRMWHIFLLQAVFLASAVLFIVKAVWPWLSGILRANGVQGV